MPTFPYVSMYPARVRKDLLGPTTPNQLHANIEAIDDVLYFWFPNGQGESGIFKKATPRMLGMGTGRNWNTVLKLADMVGLTR